MVKVSILSGKEGERLKDLKTFVGNSAALVPENKK